MSLAKTVGDSWIRTKIVCTIGPKTQSVEMLQKLYEAGMRCARMNFSHGTHEYHAQTVTNIRAAMGNDKTCAIMLDTKGPEIRSGKLVDGKDVQLEAGTEFTLKYIADDPPGLKNKGCSTWVCQDYAKLASTVSAGKQICIDDGLISLTVLRVEGDNVVCNVNNTALLGETKGINLPGTPVELPAITEKDKQDLIFGVQQGVDLIAASFVRKADDVNEIRKVLGRPGRNIKIFSKIESQEGLDNFDEILEASDGIMVARGDLGIEIPIQKVFLAQKMIIQKCNAVGKPVITATQMLESMIVNPRPTRAEVTDVANAVVQGTDCVMLSGETAKGKWPIECVAMMAEICREAEGSIDYAQEYERIRGYTHTLTGPLSVQESVTSSVVKSARDLDAKVILILSHTGATGRAVAKYRPPQPCICLTPSDQTARQLCLSRGVYPRLVQSMIGHHQLLHHNSAKLVNEGVVREGDVVVCTHGDSNSAPGSTCVMKIIVASTKTPPHA